MDSPNQESKLVDTLVNDEACRVLEIIFYSSLVGVISVLGTAANVANIIIFFKQGFNYSVNISLCGLAVSDLCSLLPLVWKSISFNPLFRYSDIGFDSVQVQYSIAGWPHTCFVRITSCITAFITFERCVCIALPLKVKTIITPKRTLISIAVIFVIMIAQVFLPLINGSFRLLFSAHRNRTLVILFQPYFTNPQIYIIITIIEQICPFFLVVIFTIILVVKVKVKSAWRGKATSFLAKSDHMVSRDKRIIKLVVFISSTFIACLLPSTINLILIIHFPTEYTVGARYENIFEVTWAICNTLEAINSSITTMIYYKMSSKYKATFTKVFTFCTTAKK